MAIPTLAFDAIIVLNSRNIRLLEAPFRGCGLVLALPVGHRSLRSRRAQTPLRRSAIGHIPKRSHSGLCQ
jgi:hypothetical protein